MTSTKDTPADVSVIVPSCNRSAMLRKCLVGLAAQTHPNFEVIVVDDGSVDDTPEMIAAFTEAYTTLRLVSLRHEPNLGANPSRNRGIAASHGRHVAFLDSDCEPEPEWLESLLAEFSSPRVGAVVGRVEDTPPRNIYDLAFRGTHRITGPKANRLIAGNMCIRRDLLERFQLDEDRVKHVVRADGTVDASSAWGCDEEGLAMSLRAGGYDLLVAPRAVATHDHHYHRKSFFEQAYRGGRATARLVYRFRLAPRLDLAPWTLAYASLPLTFFYPRLAAIPFAFLVAALVAIAYNEVSRKDKTLVELLRTFPVLILYYQVRLAGYLREALAIRTGRERIDRVRLAGTSAQPSQRKEL